jgi:hypothetical protein
MPPASRASASPRVSPRRDPGSAQEARTGPALAALSAAEEEAAWTALSADARARGEAWLRREAPALAAHTHERGHIWRRSVLSRLAAGEGEAGDGPPQRESE